MTTARTLIKSAMRKVGILTKGEEPSADEANEALGSLNAMISSWSNDSLIVYARTWETFSTIGGVLSYTIGVGGDFNTARPIAIISSYVRDGDTDYTLGILTDDIYNQISYKEVGDIPRWLNYDNAYPLATIRLFPEPSRSMPIFILSEKELAQIPTLDTEISFPPGWERALTYNLAVELAPEYGQQVDLRMEDIARKSLGVIKSATARNRKMDAFPSNPTINNIFTGWWR